MKTERWMTAAQATVLALCMALGAVGCLTTAFSLEHEDAVGLMGTLAGISALWAGLFSLKYGGWMGLVATAAGCLWLAREGTFAGQLGQLLYRVSYVYDSAYGWGYLPLGALPWDEGWFDLPMLALGTAVAGLTAWSVCRRKAVWPPLTLALAALGTCLVVTDTIPEEGWLFVLLFGAVTLLLTEDVRRQDNRQGNRLTLLAAVPVALALAGLFLVLPQWGYVDRSAQLREKILSIWESSSGAEGFGQDIPAPAQPEKTSRRVDLRALGRREESDRVVMTVTAQTGGTLYLRGQDRDCYDGAGWTSSPHRTEGFGYPGTDLGAVTIETDGVQEMVYLPYYPAGGQSLIEGVFSNTRLAERYTVRRQGLPEGWKLQAAELGAVPVPQTLEPYLALPENTRAGVEEILASILPEGLPTVQKAELLRDFVRECAQYDLEPDRMGAEDEDFALWFLKQAERGYCVHFASSAAVLLRGAGIPARYVTGYLVPVEAGESVSVTEKHAHAWVEYYEPALDTWVVLEATPGRETQMPAPELSQTPMTLPQQTETVPETISETQSRQPLAETLPQPLPDLPAAEEKPGLGWLRWLLGVAAVVLTLEGQRAVRLGLRRRGLTRGSPNGRCLKLWRWTEKLGRILGETPPERLEMLANKAKFSQHTMTEAELGEFDAYLEQAKARLARKGWLRRVFCRYFYGISI